MMFFDSFFIKIVPSFLIICLNQVCVSSRIAPLDILIEDAKSIVESHLILEIMDEGAVGLLFVTKLVNNSLSVGLWSDSVFEVCWVHWSRCLTWNNCHDINFVTVPFLHAA